ncbi:MAG: hypothetical protein AAGA65_18470, partial [Actinomycetota bacterium]
MESNGTHTTVDPQADLDLLERARAAVDLDHALDFGPWWYAPLLATCLGAASLANQDFGNGTGLVFIAVGAMTGVVLMAHDFGRRKSCPRFSVRAAAITLVAAAVVLGIMALWGAAVSAVGTDGFLPVYAAVGWVFSTAVFL